MPLICATYASVSPWNVRRLKFGDYQGMKHFAIERDKNRM